MSAHIRCRTRWGVPALLLTAILTGALMCLSGTAAAQGTSDAAEPTRLAHEVDAIAASMKAEAQPEAATLKHWNERLAKLRDLAEQCIDDAQTRIETVKSGLSQLGPEDRGTSATARQTRQTLVGEQKAAEERLTTCRAVSVNAQNLQAEVRRQTDLRVARALSARGPDLVAVVHTALDQAHTWSTSVTRALIRRSGVEQLTPAAGGVLILVLGLALALGWWLNRALSRLADRRIGHEAAAPGLGDALIASGARYAPALALSGALAAYCYLLTQGEAAVPFLAVAAFGLPAVFALILVIRTLLNPPRPASLFLDLPAATAHALGRRLTVLIWVSYVGYLVLATLFARSLPADLILAARAVIAPVLVVNLVWAVWLLGRVPPLSRTRLIHVLILASFPLALGCEWLGYRTLAEAIMRVVVGTLLIVGGGLLLHHRLQGAFDELNEGRRRWHRLLRRAMGAHAEDPLPGGLWLRALATIVLWAGCAYLLLANLGLSAAAMAQIRRLVTDGFSVGSLTINPARIAFALAFFGILLSITSWIRTRLSDQWLSRTRMERGARESVVTMTGYAGVAIAAVIALSVAGFSFTNLAIIAGALSVGIGFGLQNIVNNFVSGLILLFERPIRTGDWVIVGTTAGYVKRISIRATQIQTFDQADVIVPNSELISTQVTNWMLENPRGRVILPVGVAYGSDTRKVERILLQAAEAHEEVVTDGTSPQPLVLFLSFGDSSLDFELRCFIRQIDLRLKVISDLNFAIDAAFREEGVEIPFPQRDLHFRNPLQQSPGDGESGQDAG